jgi:glycosyltransferase involved in cell wall biosynthesis
MDKIPISVVVITRNEESNIADCLESVKWADEIVVVDDFSTDETVEIARQYTDKIFQRKMDIEGRHRNWAYAQAKNEWVLSLDADERVTDELKNEIIEVIGQGTDYSAFSVPIRNYIGNYWVRFGGWYPAPKVRLFRKDKFKYEEVGVHPRVFIDGNCGHLKSDIIHYSYRDFGDFLSKLNRQTTLEANKWFEDKRKMSFLRALWRAIDRFFRSYIRKKGYKDGFVGFMFALFAALYQLLSYAKYWELKRNDLRDYHSCLE